MRVDQQPAFVLHHREYSETSLTLEVFAPAYGRVGLLAKGARRPSSPWRGLLKPFQPLLLGWVGRGELPILVQAEGDGESLLTPGETLYCGFYLNELLLRLLHRHDPHERLYAAYVHALGRLHVGDSAEVTLRNFEAQLLAEIGYGLVLDRDIVSHELLDPEALYDYRPDLGPVRLEAAGRLAEVVGVRVHGSSLLALANDALEDNPLAQREVKRLLRASLDVHLAGRPLHTRTLFRRIMRRPPPDLDRETGT